MIAEAKAGQQIILELLQINAAREATDDGGD
jgi:hypothetical protein